MRIVCRIPCQHKREHLETSRLLSAGSRDPPSQAVSEASQKRLPKKGSPANKCVQSPLLECKSKWQCWQRMLHKLCGGYYPPSILIASQVGSPAGVQGSNTAARPGTTTQRQKAAAGFCRVLQGSTEFCRVLQQQTPDLMCTRSTHFKGPLNSTAAAGKIAHALARCAECAQFCAPKHQDHTRLAWLQSVHS